ncbi:sigma-70 family RNA polymerase sigma factor (plasmid) [Metabacillus halosaccharovorans]|uniref:RNA polymerase sigma factor n=1 Tax=Metabacillus halosaccharovorans TaxID=930124 RepID=UPI001C1FCFFB|nr:sigma-70 family RNA polymerase sigma factor [Metabacillus halosaccharovorans]MBU7595796.1 sigma-70 family RNA polymerase sigma factor [Metabacillus halosaccharovorans]MCM3441494.1 sigma-70 family RNA polymerase sigma factor [Metabacillus halosaccharovorans]
MDIQKKEKEYQHCVEILEEELKTIILTYERQLRILAYKYVQDWVLVDDIMQEVFIKVYLNLNSIENRATKKSWLYSITRNQCIDYLRSKEFKYNHIKGDLKDLNNISTHSAEHETFRKYERDMLCKAVKTLPSQYKKPLILFYYYQFSYKEISKKLDLEVGSIKNNIYRGRKMLKIYIYKSLII